MISTFAVESYCERFDLAAQIQRINSIQPIFLTGNYPLVGMNGLAEGLSIEGRRADIVSRIRMPLITIALERAGMDFSDYTEFSSDLVSGKPAYGDALKELNYSELVEMTTAFEAIPDFSDMDISGPYSPLVLSMMEDSYLSDSNINNMFRTVLLIGAEGYTEQEIVLHNDTDAYFVVLNMVKYGGKWYNNSTNTTFMMMLAPIITILGSWEGRSHYFPTSWITILTK